MKSEKIQFKQPAMHLLKLTLKGTCPMLVNRVEDHVKSDLQHKQLGIGNIGEVKTQKKKTGLTLEQVAIAKLHPGSDPKAGKFTFPAHGLKSGILEVLSGNSTTKNQKKAVNTSIGIFGVKNSKAKSAEEMIDREYLHIEGDFGIDNRTGVNAKTKALVATVRPKIKEWSAEIALEYNSENYTADQILTFLALAGRNCGLGSYRIAKGGVFGAFKIDTTSPIQNIALTE